MGHRNGERRHPATQRTHESCTRRRGVAGTELSNIRGRVAVVVITRDRRESLLNTLDHLGALPERPPIVVVDNASTDGTGAAVRSAHEHVTYISLPANIGAAARTVGVRAAGTSYVAFADDDSWWAPGALSRAANILDSHPEIGVLAGQILVGEANRPDPTCDLMAASPLDRWRTSPGPRLLGFVACGAVVRAEAYLAAGGFHHRFGVGGEETLLAVDLAALGYDAVHVPEVVAHHHPSPVRNVARRQAIDARNAMWTAWLRRPAAIAARITATHAMKALTDAPSRSGLLEACRGIPWVLKERHAIPARIERDLRLLEQAPAARTLEPEHAPAGIGGA